jgi:hypothetical protein
LIYGIRDDIANILSRFNQNELFVFQLNHINFHGTHKIKQEVLGAQFYSKSTLVTGHHVVSFTNTRLPYVNWVKVNRVWSDVYV